MLADSTDDSSIRRIAFILLTLALIILGLAYGRPFLVPIVIAILITILVGAGADRLKRLGLPEPLATMSAVLILLVGIAVVFNVLAGQADAVTQAWPRYIERLNIMADQLLRWAGPQAASKVAEAVSNLDVIRQIPGLVGSAGGFVVTVVLVTIYVGFLLAERGQLSGKIGLLFSNTEHAG
jgi:AI-2 transport protein TqsA